MGKIREANKALTKLYGLVVVAGGIIILIFLPFSLIYLLVTESGAGKLKALGAGIILLVAGIIAVRSGRHMIRTGYEPYDLNEPKS